MYACHETVESAVDWPLLRSLPSLASQHRNAKDLSGFEIRVQVQTRYCLSQISNSTGP